MHSLSLHRLLLARKEKQTSWLVNLFHQGLQECSESPEERALWQISSLQLLGLKGPKPPCERSKLLWTKTVIWISPGFLPRSGWQLVGERETSDKPPSRDAKPHVNWESKSTSPCLSGLLCLFVTPPPLCLQTNDPGYITVGKYVPFPSDKQRALPRPFSHKSEVPKTCLEPTAGLALLRLISLYICLKQLASAHEDWEWGAAEGGGAEGDRDVNRFQSGSQSPSFGGPALRAIYFQHLLPASVKSANQRSSWASRGRFHANRRGRARSEAASLWRPLTWHVPGGRRRFLGVQSRVGPTGDGPRLVLPGPARACLGVPGRAVAVGTCASCGRCLGGRKEAHPAMAGIWKGLFPWTRSPNSR